MSPSTSGDVVARCLCAASVLCTSGPAAVLQAGVLLEWQTPQLSLAVSVPACLMKAESG